MDNFSLTERSDGSFYLRCRYGEAGQPCGYCGEVTSTNAGISLERQSRLEAFEHCWSAHRILAINVRLEVSRYAVPLPQMQPILVTTKPQKALEHILARRRKAG